MPYEGEILNACGVINSDFSSVQVVAVSGDGPNVCGHLLLYVPKGGGYYFHVIGDPDGKGVSKVRGYPRYMTDAGFKVYLKENRKRELRRRALNLPNPDGAYFYVESIMAEKWTWGVLPNNCVAFVESVIEAGGGEWGSYSNCPAIATSDTVTERVNRFFQWMESSIYGLYGVPR